MSPSDIREWAEKLKVLSKEVEPQHIIWLCNRADILNQENEILRKALSQIIVFSRDKGGDVRALATSLKAVAEADDVCRNMKNYEYKRSL